MEQMTMEQIKTCHFGRRSLFAGALVSALAALAAGAADPCRFDGERSCGETLDVPEAKAVTFAAWVNNTMDGSGWQRIFDFGNGTDKYMFLTPNSGSDMRFVMKNGGNEEILSASKLGTGWHHVAVTIADDVVTLYVDGTAVASSTTMQIRPIDIRPVLNYIGHSQYKSDPVFRGYIDDIRIYNRPLTEAEIRTLASRPNLSENSHTLLKTKRLLRHPKRQQA